MKVQNRLKLISVLLIALLLLTGCNDPKSKIIPDDIKASGENSDFKKAVQKLDDKDKKILAAYIMRSEMKKAFGKNNEISEPLSIGDAIEKQKAWQQERAEKKAEQDALAAELKAQKLEKQKMMNEALLVSLTAKSYAKVKYRDQINISFGFKNLTSKDMVGIKGTAHFKDIFGDTILRVTISDDHGVKAKSTSEWHGSIDYNQFKNSHSKLRNTALEKIDFEWEPEVYLFKDGSKIRAAE